MGRAQFFFWFFLGTALTSARAFAESTDTNWQSASFWCLQTDLSPATLVFSKDRDLRLFGQATNSPVGPLTFVAFPNPIGLVISSNGPAIDCSTMNECWALVWFAGARGWTNWDSPWLIAFEHKPLRARLDSAGLKLRFGQEAGHVAMMPMYGYEKLPQDDQTALRFHSARKLETWKWNKGLPREVVQRARYWSSVLREFPIHCADTFSVDRAQDSVTIRQTIQWLPISDDWNTQHLPLHPISPPLAQASMDKTFPVSFSAPPTDLDVFTPYGPLFGLEKKTSFDAVFPLLRFINEMEVAELPASNAPPVVTAALAKLRETAAQKFHDPAKYRFDDGDPDAFLREITAAGWYAKALPYYDEPTRTVALASLRKFFLENLVVPDRLTLRNWEKLDASLLETLWAYAQFSGDWELITSHWDLVKKLFAASGGARWVWFGREATAELGGETAPSLAMARMAYAVGDLENFNFASCMFVRALVHLQVKQRGASYYREHQPWHSLERLGEEVYLSRLAGEIPGWQIDGPKYPKQEAERQFNNRWARFNNEDVGRFYREYWRADIQKELYLLNVRWGPAGRGQNDPQGLPSLVQLRSFLLNEAPEELAKVASPDQFTGSASGVIASCISILRTSHPVRYTRIIAKDRPSEFAAGVERESFGTSVGLTQTVPTRSKNSDGLEQSQWPELTWPGWKLHANAPWSFGQIVPGDARFLLPAQTIRLNWNTHVTLYFGAP